ncbi:MAG: hypothetical protein Q8L29_01180, partial [archaeon]|nr:hypothetical protein [archaeon]
MRNNKLGLAEKVLFAGLAAVMPFINGCGRERLEEPVNLYERTEKKPIVKAKTAEKKKPQSEFMKVLQRTLDYQRSFFTGNSVIGDKDESGFIEDNEIEGFEKKRFYSDENITFGFRCFYDGMIGRNLSFKLKNEMGGTIMSKSEKVRDKSDLKAYIFLPRQLKNGRYTGVWYCEGATNIGSKEKAEVEKDIMIIERGIEAKG